MRCSATVVLPEPAVPRITTKPDDGPRDQRELLRDRSGRRCRAGACRRAARRPCGSVPSRRAAPSPAAWARSAAPSPPASRGARGATRAPAAVGRRRPVEDPLGRVDALRARRSRIVTVRRVATSPLRRAPADLLLVLVALLVAVEELRDRRVPPVDDAHAVVEARGLAEAEVAYPPALAQPQVREVGRAPDRPPGALRERRNCASSALCTLQRVASADWS